jgi:hypothetical protein
MTNSSSTAGSTTPKQSDADEPSTAVKSEPVPSAELLEFLGEFADDRGEWIDPVDLDESEAAGSADE